MQLSTVLPVAPLLLWDALNYHRCHCDTAKCVHKGVSLEQLATLDPPMEEILAMYHIDLSDLESLDTDKTLRLLVIFGMEGVSLTSVAKRLKKPLSTVVTDLAKIMKSIMDEKKLLDEYTIPIWMLAAQHPKLYALAPKIPCLDSTYANHLAKETSALSSTSSA